MVKIGLTGNFASGHNLVAKIFQQNDVKVFDFDLLLKFLLNYCPKTMKKVKREYGDSIYDMGLLNLRRFNSNDDFERLLSLLHPDIMFAYEKWNNKNYKEPYTMFKCSILYEYKYHSLMDYNINVFRPINKRKESIRNTTSIPNTVIEDLLSNELSEYKKNEKANFIIRNYSNWSITTQVDDIHTKIINKTLPSANTSNNFCFDGSY